MSDGHFVRWPMREEGLKELPANFSVQATYAIDRPAPPNGQIGHIEGLGRVVRIFPAQSEQIVKCNAKLLFGIAAEVLSDESRVVTIKAGCHGRVRGKEVSCSRSG